jgi:hypothetical protein
MKNLFVLIVFALIASSCSRCKTCSSGSTLITLEATHCREDFDSGKEYRDYIKELEGYGWECD